jgi:hypothetical protein
MQQRGWLTRTAGFAALAVAAGLIAYTFWGGGGGATALLRAGGRVPVIVRSAGVPIVGGRVPAATAPYDPTQTRLVDGTAQDSECHLEQSQSSGRATEPFSTPWVLDFSMPPVRVWPQRDREGNALPIDTMDEEDDHEHPVPSETAGSEDGEAVVPFPRAYYLYCVTFPAPTTDLSVRVMEPLLNPPRFEENTVHHVTLMGCQQPVPGMEHGKPYRCAGSDPRRFCEIVFGGIVRGSMPLVYPKGSGLKIGPSTPYTTMLMEVHYSPLLIDSKVFPPRGMIDTSGIRLHVDLADEGMANPPLSHPALVRTKRPGPSCWGTNVGSDLPASLLFVNLEEFTLPGKEPFVAIGSAFTGASILEHLGASAGGANPLRLFGAWFHGHLFARTMKFYELTSGKRDLLLHLDPFSGEARTHSLFYLRDAAGNARNVTIKPDANYRVECTFDTTKAKTRVVGYGMSPLTEMCTVIMFFYGGIDPTKPLPSTADQPRSSRNTLVLSAKWPASLQPFS